MRWRGAVEAECFFPGDVDAVAGDDPEGQVGVVAEHGGVAGDDDVGEQRVLAVHADGPVDGGDEGHLEVGEPLDDAAASR